MSIINIRESLNRLDLQTDNKYDLLNTYDCSKISDDKKKELAEALNKNASAKTISRILDENSSIKIFPRDSEEYEKLDRVATFLTAMSPNKYYYYVGKTYFDYGQDWKWTTILAQKNDNGLYEDSYQALNPREQKEIILANSDEELEEIAKDILRNDHIDKGFNESLDVLEYDDEMSDTWADLFNVASPQEVANTFKKSVKAKDKIYKPTEESLKEDIENYSEEDIDDNYSDDVEVESGNYFFADGKDYVWEERIAGPTYLDFDKWAVWSAREITPLKDFIIGKNEQGGYDVDEYAYIEAVKSKSSVYFVVEEDTGFIDWGPVETQTEAQDFLNSKEEDFWNDEESKEIEIEEESLKESKDIKDTGYSIILHYDDIGNGEEYDYEANWDDVVDFIMDTAWSNGDGPEDANEDEYLRWVIDNLDELADKYESNILDYFEDEASQYEYDHRDDEPW